MFLVVKDVLLSKKVILEAKIKLAFKCNLRRKRSQDASEASVAFLKTF